MHRISSDIGFARVYACVENTSHCTLCIPVAVSQYKMEGANVPNVLYYVVSKLPFNHSAVRRRVDAPFCVPQCLSDIPTRRLLSSSSKPR